MASFTTTSRRKRERRAKNAGHARKMKMGARSTLSYAELFAGCGEPGAPAPKASKAPAKK